jgi:hypothetical protein
MGSYCEHGAKPATSSNSGEFLRHLSGNSSHKGLPNDTDSFKSMKALTGLIWLRMVTRSGLLNAAMNLQGPQNAGNFLAS